MGVRDDLFGYGLVDCLSDAGTLGRFVIAFWLLLAGGALIQQDLLSYQKIPMGHVCWHVFVLGGAGLMFASIYISL